MRYFNRLQVFLLTILFFIQPQISELHAQTTVTGNITTNTTWDLAGSPYIVEANIGITADDTLWIEPDVEIHFKSDISLVVAAGHLEADGVTFTSADQTGKGAWGQIHIRDHSNSSIDDAGSANITNSTIQYGDQGALFVEYGTVTIKESEIRNSNIGLRVGSNAEKVTVSDLVTSGNGWPMTDASVKALEFSGNQTISGNDHHGVRVDATNLTDTNHSLDFIPVPYVFENNLSVDQNAVLAISPEATLKFAQNNELTVNGTLIADGSSVTEPIQMTSLKNDNIGGDTNNDGTASSPASSDWRGVVFSSTAQDSSLMDNVEISFAGRDQGASTSSRGAVTFQSASPMVRNSKLLNSFSGFVLTGTASPTLENNEVGTSELFPLMMTFNANPTLSNNVLSFQDNEFDAVGLIGTSLSEDATLIKRNFTDVPNITYAMLNDLEIPAGITLNVEDGVVVKAKDARFVVKGTLNVNGIETSRTVFTSIHDDSEGNPGDTDKNGNNTVPEERDWDGFVFDAGSDASVMDFATIRYAGGGNWNYDFGGARSAVIVADAGPAVINTEISQTDIGITVIRDGAPTIQNNTISNTQRTPVALSMSANPTMNDNNVENAGLRAIGLVSETVRFDGTISQRSLGGFENITYAMLGSITIANGTTVTIDPGVVIKGDNRHDLFVDGALSAAGNETDGPIIFTSIKDDNIGNPLDTNNDGNGSAPAGDDWGTIMFRSSADDANSLVDSVEIRFAKHGIVMSSAAIPVNNTTISNTRFWALALDGDSSPQIQNVTIQSTARDPIAMSTLAVPSFTDITFDDNNTNGIALIEGTRISTSTSSNNDFNRGGKYFSGSSTISNDATLIKRNIAGFENIPYVITYRQTSVGENTRLNIEPGVVLKFDGGGRINVDGALIAEGTETEKIYFTSLADDSQGGDTNNDGNSSEPGRGDWSGINFNDSSIESENVLNNVSIRFAGKHSNQLGVSGIVNFQDSHALLDSVIIEQISANGIGVFGNANPDIRNTQILNLGQSSQGAPIIMDMFANLSFDNNTISNVANRVIAIRGETWTNDATVPKRSFAGFDNITYQLVGDITIGSGTTITIPEGVVFKSEGRLNSSRPNSFQYIVDGTLQVLGTETDPVVFTHIEDDEFGNPLDTRNNGEQIENRSNLWNSWIVFESGSDDANSIVDHAILRYRLRNSVNSDAIKLNNASPTIKNSRFEFNSNAISLNGVSEPVLENNIFHDTGRPILASILSFPATATGNEITGSTTRAIGIQRETLVQDFTLPRRTFAGIDGIPYFFTDDYTVGSGAILTIEPGVVMKINGGRSLNIKKGLVAEGTPDSMIVFTAIEDDFYGGDTNADSSQSSPTGTRNQWKGIHFEGESLPEFSKLDHTIIRYAAAGWDDDSQFREFAGINTNNASPTITNSILQRNRYGLKAEGSSNPVINNNDIFNNREFGVWNVDQTFTIDATNNWWGDDSGPTHASNPSGEGDAVTDAVNFDPWIGSGSSNPVPGDVSLNGQIQAFDGSLVLRHAVSLETLSEDQLAVADVSDNGSVSAMDASYILQYVVGTIESFPASETAKENPSEPTIVYNVSDVRLTVGQAETSEKGREVTIPLKLDQVEDMISLEAELTFDPAKIEFEQAIQGEMLEGANVLVNEKEGSIKIAMAALDAINSGGEAMKLKFRLPDPEQLAGGKLHVQKFMANEKDLTASVVSNNQLLGDLPDDYALQKNYPNPFNPSTTIAFSLPEVADVQLDVFNIIGQKVATLVSQQMEAGQHTVRFNASRLSSGLYFYRIQAGDFVSTQKMMLVK